MSVTVYPGASKSHRRQTCETRPEIESHAAFLARLSREHYIDGLSKVELAKRHSISRFQVARFLAEAVESGIVRIEIVDPDEQAGPRPQDLARMLGVERVTIAPAAPSPGTARQVLAGAVAERLHDSVGAGDVLGLAWSRTLAAAVEGIGQLPDCDIVQLAGAIPLTSDTEPRADGVEFIGQLTRLAPGRTSLVFAPLVVDSPETAAHLLPQPEIAAALRRAGHLDVACAALGAWQPGSSTVFERLDAVSRTAVADQGGAVEFCGRILDARGRAVTVVDDRIVGVSLAQLRSAGHTIGVALGPELSAGVQAAAASGVFDEFVLGRELAQTLHADLERARSSSGAAHKELS